MMAQRDAPGKGSSYRFSLIAWPITEEERTMDTIELDLRLRHAAGYLGRTPLMLIDGKLVPAASGKTFAVYNPATGAVIANVPELIRRMSIMRSPPRGAPLTTGAGPMSAPPGGARCCGSWPT